MAAATDMVDGKMGKSLRKFLKKHVVDAGLKDKLAVSDKALGADQGEAHHCVRQ